MEAIGTPPSQATFGQLEANRGERIYEPCEATMFMNNKDVTLKPRQSAQPSSLAETTSAKTAGPTKQVCVTDAASKKNSFLYVRSRNVYENKGQQDTMPEQKQTFWS